METKVQNAMSSLKQKHRKTCRVAISVSENTRQALRILSAHKKYKSVAGMIEDVVRELIVHEIKHTDNEYLREELRKRMSIAAPV
jgi:ABC-type lipopolysaccharide export system ATPase subunit